MANHVYKVIPKGLAQWSCAHCGIFNPLFDTRCAECFEVHPFDAKAKSQLTALCKRYSDESCAWNTLPENAFQFQILPKAITNKLYKIEIRDPYAAQFSIPPQFTRGVLRIFNHRINLSLDQLLSVYTNFASAGIGTPIFGSFDIGQIEQWIDGRDLTDDELLHDARLSGKVANVLSKVHQLRPASFDETKCGMLIKMASNLETASQIFDEQMRKLSKLEQWNFVLAHTQRQANMTLNRKLSGKTFAEIMKREIETLVQRIEASSSLFTDLVFCHNDYHSGNIILESQQEMNERKEEEAAKSISIKVIDYEYSGYNYRAYDFGNFFNELMIDNYCKDPPFFSVKLENYPSREYRKRFVKEYMNGLPQSAQIATSDADLEAYLKDIEYGTMLSHLWWAIWGVVESQRNDIEWNYMEYARQRLLHFFRIKHELQQHFVANRTPSKL